ncbi:hypothetical protein B0T14DRAFT_567773 [Immersiella caudata]|uniref:Uncharacterized protein n=1 Tax=Immersiella caudata TaxID=314043 RepID=A0AA39WIQ7_9PEZI|nr:hypothetical protein B0T14DRAFT_567773 [Immersiella caudata]
MTASVADSSSAELSSTLTDDTQREHNGLPRMDEADMPELRGSRSLRAKEVIYNQEVDKNFLHLRVSQMLEFAESCHTPSSRIQDMSRQEYCWHMARVYMAIFGLSHTY